MADDAVAVRPSVDEVRSFLRDARVVVEASFAGILVVHDPLDDRPPFGGRRSRPGAVDLALEPTEADVVLLQVEESFASHAGESIALLPQPVGCRFEADHFRRRGRQRDVGQLREHAVDVAAIESRFQFG